MPNMDKLTKAIQIWSKYMKKKDIEIEKVKLLHNINQIESAMLEISPTNQFTINFLCKERNALKIELRELGGVV